MTRAIQMGEKFPAVVDRPPKFPARDGETFAEYARRMVEHPDVVPRIDALLQLGIDGVTLMVTPDKVYVDDGLRTVKPMWRCLVEIFYVDKHRKTWSWDEVQEKVERAERVVGRRGQGEV